MKLNNPTLLAILCTLVSAAPVDVEENHNIEVESPESRYSNYAYPASDYHYSMEAANENHPTLHQRQIYQRNGHLYVGGNPQGYSEDGQPADWPWNPAHKDLKVANQNRPFIVFIDSQGNLNAENHDDSEQYHITIDPSTSAMRINVGDSPTTTSDRHWGMDRTFNQMSTARRNFKTDQTDAIAYACVINRSPDQRWQAARNPTYDQKYEDIQEATDEDAQATKEFSYKETNKKEIWYKETDVDSPPADTQYTPPEYAIPPNYEYDTRPAVDPEYQLYMSPDTRFACPNGERAITVQLQGRDQNATLFETPLVSLLTDLLLSSTA